ncbi:MAG: hypothetical protein OK474_10080 [Thaumarchaeota archaeon]|nr:hypothetical protein [Nitrososphaerota archaeon]
MKSASWDALGLDRRRMSVIVICVGMLVGLLLAAVTFQFLGQLALVLGAVVGLGSGYAVAAIPRRSIEKSALEQARESPALAAAASVYLQSSGSKSKTVLMLRSDEPRLSAVLGELRRTTLLGMDPAESYARMGGKAESESVSKILGAVVRAQGERLVDEGEELEGMVLASLSKEETKFPVFLTVCFFLPIMLMLLAAIGHHTDPIAMVSLTFLELVVLDLALALSSTERKRLSS